MLFRGILSIITLLFVSLTAIHQAQCQKPPVQPPHLTKLVKPDCSPGTSCHGIHGMVIVTVDVLTDGTVGDANVKSGDPKLSDAALQAAKQCRFQPGKFNGKLTSMNFDLEYQF